MRPRSIDMSQKIDRRTLLASSLLALPLRSPAATIANATENPVVDTTAGKWPAGDPAAIWKRYVTAWQNCSRLAAKSKVSPATIRELQYNKLPRRRHPRTLEAVSTALDWPADYLSDVLAGKKGEAHEDEQTDPVLGALDEIHDQLQEIRARLAAVERQLAFEDGPASRR